MKRLSVLGLVAAIVLGAVLLPAVAVGDAQAAPPNGSDTATSFNDARFVVTVYENGSARWTQRYNQPLTNESQTSRFRAYANRFGSEETPLYTDFRERATTLTAGGSNATGRSMDARDFRRDTRVSSQPQTTGVVEMSFLWTNFTSTEGGHTVGESFESGLYLSRGMSLEFRAGPNLEVDWESVEPAADASTNGSANTTDSLTYFGPAQFASGQPHVVFTEESALADDEGSSSELPLLWGAGILIVILVGGVIAWRSGIAGTGDEPPDPGAAAEAETGDDATSEDGPATSAPPEPAVSAAEMKTDADRIAELLDANGGRMQQGDIVERTDWSKSKVSTLLSEMAEEGRVSKLRVGRENIVSLDGHEPDITGSPFDDG
ncbi:helix-turn-helix transcriptional regulator [Halococcus qingdaonensis]|uniref:helix-turn-helix transcriptional regulator n=1 Tax=Halococcus qingdaonensis TaxID=224402 RepID=UPI002116BA98|nr:helix-turn-helix domain-containing protein [Halococcus qingdaonensis]